MNLLDCSRFESNEKWYGFQRIFEFNVASSGKKLTIIYSTFSTFQNWHHFVTLSFLITLCNGYKVLLLAPINGKSHFLYMSSFARALLDRGHEVTFLTSNSLSHLKLANYTEVLIDPPQDLMSFSKFN